MTKKMEDVTNVIFKYATNISVFYSSGGSLEDLIRDSRVLGVTTDALNYADLGPSLAKDNSVTCLNVLPSIVPYVYGDYDRYDKEVKRVKDYLGYVKRSYPDANFNFLWGSGLPPCQNYFDWVILDIDGVEENALKMALGKDLEGILKDAKKVGRNVAYIRPIEKDDADLAVKCSLEKSRAEGKPFQESFVEVISKPVEIQADDKLPRIVSRFRAAGFRDVYILYAPTIRNNPYASLSRSLFIYAEGEDTVDLR